jgi:hypothetical protein
MRSNGLFVLVGCGAIAVSGLAGCGSAEPFTDAGGAGGGDASGGASGGAVSNGGAGGASTGTAGAASSSSTGSGTCVGLGDPCTECEATECQQQYCACAKNADCVQLAGCGSSCAPNDATCLQACWTASPNGIADGALLVDCAAEKCAAGCPGLTTLTPCQECLYQQCPGAMNTCVANAQCSLLLYCVASCTEPACQDACYAQHPEGLDDAGPVGACARMHCSATCG